MKKKALMIGDNCIDIYKNLGCGYITGNVVDTGINMAILGSQVGIITNIAKDNYGDEMLKMYKKYGVDCERIKVIDGKTAYTIMTLEDGERIHGDYFEGVLENMKFFESDIKYALNYDLIFSAFWGKAEEILIEIKKINDKKIISYDYADRVNDPKVDRLDGIVDIGFFSWSDSLNEAKKFLKNRFSKGMKIGVTTFGEKGSLAYDGKEFYEQKAYKVEDLNNTVGAGDSFIAGFLSSYLLDKDIKECLDEGSKLASKIVRQFGPILNEEVFKIIY